MLDYSTLSLDELIAKCEELATRVRQSEGALDIQVPLARLLGEVFRRLQEGRP